MPIEDFKTFVLVEEDKAYIKSTAALRVFKKLGGGWNLLYAFILLPLSLRDSIYNFVAKNRYGIFGKSDSCLIPTPEIKAKFLL